jgi:hypothetical protein
LPSSAFPLDTVGYLAEEYFVSGSARSYAPVGALDEDGHWTVEEAAIADYVTRVVVHRPIDAQRFNGTVLVEWLNVSSGMDGPPEWLMLHRHLVRSGIAWVGVSVQRAGIEGGGFVEGQHLKLADPERYGRLMHPGDAFAFDIFGQATQLMRAPAGQGVLGDTTATRVIGAGSSQSAMGLVTYINAVDPLVRAHDGFLVHGRGAAGLGLDGVFIRSDDRVDEPGDPPLFSATRHRIRTDVGVPVLVFQTETDVVVLGGGRARQDDTERVRWWEVAGAAHFDTYGLNVAFRDDGARSPAELAEWIATAGAFEPPNGAVRYNRAWQQHYLLQAAVAHLERWAGGGDPPPTAPRLRALDADATALARDASGIVEGGLRTPWVEAPLAVFSGERVVTEPSDFGFLFGTTTPLDDGELRDRYPGGRVDYEEQFAAATDAAIAAGFLLPEDRDEIVAVAREAWEASHDRVA